MKKISVLIVALLLSVVSFSQSANRHNRGSRYDRSESVEYVYVANAEQVQAIVGYIKSLSFDDKKMDAAKLCVRICPIPLYGIEQIVKEFSFDDNRLEFLQYAFAYAPIKKDYHLLANSLTFNSNKDKLYEFLGYKN